MVLEEIIADNTLTECFYGIFNRVELKTGLKRRRHAGETIRSCPSLEDSEAGQTEECS